MRAKRSKSYKRAMALYTTAFKFRQPYQVLVDGEFVKRMTQQKLDPTERLADILGGDTKIMITQCVVARLSGEGMESKEATKAARGFERRKCNHWKTKETDGECIAGIVGNDNRYRYCVATQSVALRGALRRVPGVPILFEKRGMVLLEPPSDASVGTRKKIEESKLHIPKEELELYKPKASTSRQREGVARGNATAAAPSTSTDDKPSEPASGVTDASSIPAATRATIATRPNTVEQKLERAHERTKKRKMKEPNPLSIKRKKPNATAPAAPRKASAGKKASTKGDRDVKAEKKESTTSTEEGGKVEDDTKGVTRQTGDGTSKKALKRKRKRAEKGQPAAQTSDSATAKADPTPKVDSA